MTKRGSRDEEDLPVCIYLYGEVARELRKFCERRGHSYSAVVATAMGRYLAEEIQKEGWRHD